MRSWNTGRMIQSPANTQQRQATRQLSGVMDQHQTPIASPTYGGALANAQGGQFGSGITLPQASPSSNAIAGFVNQPPQPQGGLVAPTPQPVPIPGYGGTPASPPPEAPITFEQQHQQRYGKAATPAPASGPQIGTPPQLGGAGQIYQPQDYQGIFGGNGQSPAAAALAAGVSPANIGAYLYAAGGLGGANQAENIDRFQNPNAYMTPEQLALQQQQQASWAPVWAGLKQQGG